MSTTTMTLNEFLNINRTKEFNELERLAKRIRRNKRIERFVVFLIACSLYAFDVYANPLNTKAIDAKGLVLLVFFRKVGYWSCIIMCIIEILKSAFQGDTKGITKIITKYLIIFSALYFVPALFDWIIDLFS